MTQQTQVQSRPGGGSGKSEDLKLDEVQAPDSKEAVAKADAALKQKAEPTLEEKLQAIRERFGCCFSG